jgi:hypothetical protein
MMLKIEVAENGTVMIRETIDGQYHRRTILPGDDYSGEQDAVFAACEKAHRPEVVQAFLAAKIASLPTPEEALAQWRATARCSPMQGKLALGQAAWVKIELYRDTATWAERVVIDSAQEWRRNSQDIQFFGYMLEFDDAELDALFEAAMQIAV